MLQNNTALLLLMLIGLSAQLSTKKKSSSSDSSSEDVNPLAEFIVGVIFFIFSFPILWYNEYKAAQNEVNISKAKKYCISIDNEYINSTYEGQLVHINGRAYANDVIFSKKFGVQASQSMSLEREVETYQWVKHEETKGTGKNKKTIITYQQEWKKVQQQSYEYPHENPESFWTVKHKTKLAKNVNLGVYELSKSLKRQALHKVLILPQDQWISFAGASYPDRKQQMIHINGDYLYFSQLTGTNTIGDQRIQFYQVPCDEVTVVSKLKGNTFEPYPLNVEAEFLLDDHEERKRHSTIYVPNDFMAIMSNERLGIKETINRLLEPMKYIDWLVEFKLNKDEIFDFKLAESRRLAWYMRFFGFIIMTIGLFLMFQPVIWIISWFPLLGNFLGQLSTFLFYCVSILIAIPISLLTIAIAWLRFHPLKALILLLSGGCMGLVICILIN